MYSSPARPSFFKRKFFAFILTVCLLAAVAFLSRNFLLIKGLDYLLGSVFPKSKSHKIVYDRAYWEGSRVIISGMHLLEEDLDVNIDRVEVEFHFNFRKCFFEPHLKMIHPQIRILSTDSEVHSVNILGALIPTKAYCLKLNVQSGVVQIDTQRLYFSFKSKEEKQQIGTLYVTHDPSLMKDSYLIADFQMHEKKLYCSLNIEQMASERLLQLLTLAYPQVARGWENAQGQTQLKGKAILDFKNGIEELTCQFSIQNLEIANPKKQLIARAQSFNGNFSYPAAPTDCEESDLIWKQMVSTVVLEKGEIHLQERWSVADLYGHLTLSPHNDPQLELQGNIQTPSKPLKFKLDGKGALHEDESFWLELAMRLKESSEKECALHISLCSPEKQSFVVQAEFQEMLGDQLDLFRSFLTDLYPVVGNGKIESGTFQGKCMAWFDKSGVSHFECEHFAGVDIVLNTIENKNLRIEKLKLNGHLSQISPLCGEMNLESNFPLNEWTHDSTVASSSLNANIKWRKGASKVAGSLIMNDPKDLLQFGFECAHIFPEQLKDIKEGWLHSAALSPLVYGTILKSIAPALHIQGEMDVCGTFDGKELQLSLQANQLRASFSTLEMQARTIGEKDPLFLKTEGRAKISYDLANQRLEAKIPLTDAKILETKQQFLLDNINGDLILSIRDQETKIQGKCRSSDLKIPDHTLLEEMEFNINIDGKTGQMLIENLKGKTALQMQTPYLFLAKTILLKDEDSLIDAKFMQNGKECILIKAVAPKSFQEWKGEIQLTKEMGVQATFDTHLFADPAKAHLFLQASCQDGIFGDKSVKAFALALEKHGSRYLIKQLQADDLTFKGSAVYEKGFFHLTDGSLQWKDLAIKGGATISFDMQNKENDWAVQAVLGFDLATTTPCPLQLHFHPGMKAAFSPHSGFMMTNIHCSGENSECLVEYIEFLPKIQKWRVQNCKCELAPNFIGLLSAKWPQLKNVPLDEPLKSVFNLNFEKNTFGAVGKIYRACSWAEKKQDLLFFFERKESKGKLVLQEIGHEERVQLDLNFDKESVVEKITGAIAGLTLHLKQEDSLVYAGEAKIDFNQLLDFLPQNLKESVSNWKIGNGYQLQGEFHLPEEGFKDLKFKGKISGEDFECMGIKLKKLEAKAHLTSKEAVLENLQIKDEFGQFTMKKAHFASHVEQGHWSFSIPLLSLSDFSPYSLKGETNKNFLVKQGTLTNFSGRVGDMSTFKGQGSFHFTNLAKKEFSLFEIPLEIIKNLGLDPGLFTPVIGEVEFDVNQGKCMITKLRNVRSEGGRSEFYLPQAPISSYLDLNGNLFVDLKMKQNVVLNLTEPFTLSIRGTFKEPKYSLR